MITCGFYNSVAGDRKYNAEQMSSLFEGIIKDGVFMSIGQKLMVTPKTGMNVAVGTGRAWFNKTWTNNDGEYPLTIETSEVVLNRIDVIALEVNANDANRANTIKIIKGTPSSVPVAPTLTLSEKVNQYPLAHVYVAAGVTSIVGGNITNKVGTTACPFITGVMETMDVDALLAQWNSAYLAWFNGINMEGSTLLTSFNSQFQALFTSIDNDGASLIDQLDTEFNTWFSSLTAILDTNVAANLTARLLIVEDTLANGVATAAQGVKADNALPATAKAVDSDKLDGKDASEFLLVGAKAVDSDKLDGLHSTEFMGVARNTSDVNTILLAGSYRLDGNLNIPADCNYGHMLVIRGPASMSDTIVQIIFGYNNTSMYFRSCTVSTIASTPWVKVWNTRNDGAGSGLDADFLDGISREMMYTSKGDIAGNVSGAVAQGATAYRILANVAGMLYPEQYGAGACFSSGQGGGQYSLNLYSTGSKLWIQKQGDGNPLNLASWNEMFGTANYGNLVFATGSFTLSAADNHKVIYMATNANATITIPLGLPAEFECTVINNTNGALTTTFVSGVASILSNPDSTKRTLNGAVAVAWLRRSVGDNAYFLTGNLKV